jgi:hypothetical protein
MTPHPGTLIVTLLVVAGLLWANSAGALPLRAPAAASTSTGTIAYQGRLADADGNPITNTVNMIFRLYDVASGGVFLWEEQWTGSNGVQVSDGLFNVMLGSLTPIPQSVITGHDSLFLGITVGTDDEMQPRVQLGSVPFAVQALTVPDGSITTDKLNLLDGNVGIGTTTPASKLHVHVPASESPISAMTVDVQSFSNDANARASHYFQVRDIGAGKTSFYIRGDGYVGIGTTSPGAKLDVISGGNPISKFYSSDSANKWVEIGNAATHMNLGVSSSSSTTPNFPYIWSQSDKLMIGSDGYPTLAVVGMGNGNVGIRTTNPGAALDVNGDFRATGTKSAVVQAGEYGQRKLYAAESPEVRFFDEGLAHLKEGMARVALDPIFLETIEGEYLVHVTPYGDASLYVAEVGKDYFVVKARDGDPNVAFAWRLSAHRKGYAGVRLEQVEDE